MSRTVRPYTEIGAALFAVLLTGPATWIEVRERAKLSKSSAEGWFGTLREAGVLRCCGYAPHTNDDGRGKRARIYELQAPFARPDEPYPTIQPFRKNRDRSAPKMGRLPQEPSESAPSWDFEIGRDLADVWRPLPGVV